MPISFGHAVSLVAVAVIATVLTRALPFILFSGKREMPEAFHKLGRLLPPAMIATLIVYCVRKTEWQKPGSVLSEGLSLALVIILHKWKKNTILSIGGGTLCYMLLIRAFNLI